MARELEIIQLEVGLLQNLVTVIGCPETKEAMLVDPAFEIDRILKVVDEHGWRVTAILVTHTHIDHVAGLDEAAAATEAQVRCHLLEVAAVSEYAPRVSPVADGEELRLGADMVRAIYTPGHTPGCVCWYLPDTGAVMTGDVLFVGSCGGVNYADSDPEAMYHSLHHKLGVLPEETKIYPGHNYGQTTTSTLGWEFLHNRAYLASSYIDFCRYKQVRPKP